MLPGDVDTGGQETTLLVYICAVILKLPCAWKRK